MMNNRERERDYGLGITYKHARSIFILTISRLGYNSDIIITFTIVFQINYIFLYAFELC